MGIHIAVIEPGRDSYLKEVEPEDREGLEASYLGAVEAKLQELFPEAVFATRIRNNIALAEAPTEGKDVFAYAPRSNGAKDYQALTREIIEKEGKK